MGDALKKVQPGQPLQIPAAAYNAFVDAALDYRQRQQDRGGPTQRGGRAVVLVRNDSGADRARFEVLGIDAPLVLPADHLDGFREQVALKGVMPSAAWHVGRLLILQEPLASGSVGRAILDGISLATLDVQGEGDSLADISHNSAAALKTGPCGSCQILWKEAGTGLKWGVVRIGQRVPSGWFWARIDGSALLWANRYKYAWSEQERIATGWQAKTNGRSGTTSSNWALNSIEAANAATGIMGNSVNHSASDYPSGFSLQAVRGTPVVQMQAEIGTDGSVYYSFSYENAEDGTCS